MGPYAPLLYVLEAPVDFLHKEKSFHDVFIGDVIRELLNCLDCMILCRVHATIITPNAHTGKVTTGRAAAQGVLPQDNMLRVFLSFPRVRRAHGEHLTTTVAQGSSQ